MNPGSGTGEQPLQHAAGQRAWAAASVTNIWGSSGWFWSALADPFECLDLVRL